MASELAQLRCIPCRGGVPPLKGGELQTLLAKLGGGWRVVLVLKTSEPLREFTLTDPLPGGGERTFTYEVLEGELTLTYDLPPGVPGLPGPGGSDKAPALTDPQVRWRYP